MNRSAKLAITCGAALLASACATRAPVPDDALQAAGLAVAKAEEARAAEFAPQSLQQAREKLTLARADAEQRGIRNRESARRYAEQAQADAELAVAVSEAARARIAAAEVDRSIVMLNQTQR